MAGRLERGKAGTLRCGEAGPGGCFAAGLDQDFFDHADRGEDLVERHRPEVADAEDLAGELALASSNDELASLELAVERFPVQPVRNANTGHGLGGNGEIGEELETESLEARSGRCGARGVAREDRLLPLLLHVLQRHVQLEHDRDGRGPRRLPVALAVTMLGEIQIEAGHPRGPGRLPGPLGQARQGNARRRHPALLAAGYDDVEAPRVLLEWDGTDA